MRRAPTDILCCTALAVVVVACTHEVDRFPAYQGTPGPGAGSIGSGPAGGDDDSSSSGDDDSSGSDDDGGDPADGDGSSPGSGPSTSATGAPTDDSGATGVGETGSGDPVLAACLDVAINECETCACNLCLDPLYACQQDVGCVAMRDCAEQTGCVGVDCLEPCGDVINMHGGAFGDSGALALALSDCLSASCPACF